MTNHIKCQIYVIDSIPCYLCRKLRSSVDNTSESNDKLNNEESVLDDHEASAQRNSPDMKNNQDAVSEDMDLYKRIQVLQQINPAIKVSNEVDVKILRIILL